MEGIMRPTTNRTLLASLGIVALGIVAAASVQSNAEPQNPESANVATWIQSAPNQALIACPASKLVETAAAPWFGFGVLANPVMASCSEDGPYTWGGNLWYLQRIKGFQFTDGTMDAIRVCTPAAVEPGRTSHFTGPCHTKDGAGPRGCELCVKGGRAL
jgi:hypothetical protein